MKSKIILALVVATLVNIASGKSSKEFDTKPYADVELNILKITLDDYKNKKIAFEGLYSGLLLAFPQVLVKNGKSDKKYFALNMQPLNLPVIVKKSGDFKDTIPKIQKNKYVKVYGKVREFRQKNKKGRVISYYLELDHIVVLDKKVPPKTLDEKINKLIDKKARKKIKNRRR